jgi:hypothetical protein
VITADVAASYFARWRPHNRPVDANARITVRRSLGAERLGNRDEWLPKDHSAWLAPTLTLDGSVRGRVSRPGHRPAYLKSR